MNYLAVDLIGTNDHKIMNKLYFIPIVFFTLIFLPGLSAYAETDQLYVSLDSILNNNDHFGISVSQIGDLNNDGVVDIAVGAYKDDDGGQDRGALYIIFLNNDGTVKSFQKISDTAGGFDGVLDDGDEFGNTVIKIGDLNNDGVVDIAVGADDDGGQDRGALYIIFLNNDGTVKSFQKISSNNESSWLQNNDFFI